MKKSKFKRLSISAFIGSFLVLLASCGNNEVRVTITHGGNPFADKEVFYEVLDYKMGSYRFRSMTDSSGEATFVIDTQNPTMIFDIRAKEDGNEISIASGLIKEGRIVGYSTQDDYDVEISR